MHLIIQSIILAKQNIKALEAITEATGDKVTYQSMLQSNHSIVRYLEKVSTPLA